MWGQPDADEPVKRESRVESIDETGPPRSSLGSRDHVRSSGRDRAPATDDRSTGDDATFSAAESAPRRPQSSRDENSSSNDPERRSQRQQPRRGRQADVRADAAFGEPMVESLFDDDLPPATRLPEVDRAPRPERGARPERSGRDDRPSRSPRGETDSRSERGPRPPRDENRESADVVENRGERLPRPEGTARPEGIARPARSEASGDRPPRSERADRPPRADRGDRPPRAEGTDRPERSARPERSDRPDRSDRPARPERNESAARADGPGRGDRPARAEGGERRPRRDRPEKTERSANPTVSRDASPERRPAIAKKPSGFGAGIQDDDVFGFGDTPAHSSDDFESDDGHIEVDSDSVITRDSTEREGRPKRRRGRGRRSEGKGGDSHDAVIDPRDAADERDNDDSSDFISKNSRIPSWQDAIGTLVATNMENHQRNQSQNRGPRGRAPRRDR